MHAKALIALLIFCWFVPDPGGPANAQDDYELPPLGEYTDDGFGWEVSLYGLINFATHGLGHGGGAQLAYPIMPNGFVPAGVYRDALHIEAGLDFQRWVWEVQDVYVSEMAFAPNLGARYAVYLTDWLAPILTLRLGVGLPVTDGVDRSTAFYWSATAGALMDLGDMISVRAEFGWGRYDDLIRLGVLIRL